MVARARRYCGFTYLTVLFIVAIMGVGLALVGEVWHTSAVREKEAELLYAGNQYRIAITRYYLAGPQQYPRELSDLLKDPRKPGTERYLRKLYPDPVTGKGWGIVKAPDGGIMGVHSLSENIPLKRARFRISDQGFEGATRYADWKFVYVPATSQKGAPVPLRQPATPVQQSPSPTPLAPGSR